jgi:hypothetical protein
MRSPRHSFIAKPDCWSLFSKPAIAILPGTSRQRRERACCRFDKRANTLK